MNAEFSYIFGLMLKKKKLILYHIFLNDVKRYWGCWLVYVYDNSNKRFQNFLKVNKSKYTVVS